MRARLLKLFDTLLRNFWFLPGLMMAAGIGLYLVANAFNTSQWVRVLQEHGVVYSGGFAEAQTILTVIAQTMVAIASLAFATVAVVLTLATSQFGHRLVRSFMRDKPTQFAFGIFVTTFIYSLLVLYAVRNSDGVASVPSLSVSIAFYLAVVAGATLIYFTHHIAQMIAAPSVIAEVGEEMDATIERSWPPRTADAPRPVDADAVQLARRRLDDDSETVRCPAPGYIQTLDTTGLTILAEQCDVLIEMLRRPGDYLFDGTPIARVWPAHRCDHKLKGRIRQSMVIGKHRTPMQDLRFAFNQVAEIAVRAMSPALNDPFTALDCVNRIGAGIGRLAAREEPSPYQADDDGRLRLIMEPVGFDELVSAAFTPVRNYSRESVIVTLQMLHALRELAPQLRNERQRRAVALQAALIRRGADDGLVELHDRLTAQSAYESALRDLQICEADLPPARQICLNSKQDHRQGRSS
ncbi:MAG TPA: DUF2254 domain-containing protein [Gammaproteobacteria bacterium]|nr:DUF2254 domain-containing protein [Gammaproteobacteria bacterium]